MATSATSRNAAQPAGAGRSASQRAGIGDASRARVRAAIMSNAVPLSVLQKLAIVVDDPVARSAPAPAPPRNQAKADISISVDRPSSIVHLNLQTTKSAKKKCRQRPQAATPLRRPVQVALCQRAPESAPASCARVWATSMSNAATFR